MQKVLCKTSLPIFASLCLVILAGGCAEDTKQQANNDFESALNNSELPWYDSESKQLTSSAAPDRPASSVSDRNRIPPVPQKAGKPVQRTPQPPAGGGAAAGPNGLATAGTSLIYIAGGILACIVVALLIYGFLKLESGGGEDESKESKGRKIRDHIRHLPFEIEEQEGDFETFAEKSLREGNYNNAVIYLFADVLVAMSESDVVRLQRGKTNRQYLNDIWDHDELKGYFQTVMIAFEDAFFGKHQIDKVRAEDCFAGRPAFDNALEKIRASKFTHQQTSPTNPSPAPIAAEAAR